MVDEPVAAEQRNPRDHADDVRGPERNRADEEQHHLHGHGADVKGEEIGDGEADDERRQPDDEAEFRRRQIGLQDRAEIRQLGEAALEGLGVAARREGRQHLVIVVVPETDDDDEDERDDEEEQEHQAERHRLKPARHADAVEPAPGRAMRDPATVVVEMLVRSLVRAESPLLLLPAGGHVRDGRSCSRRADALEDRSQRQAAMNSFHLRTM